MSAVNCSSCVSLRGYVWPTDKWQGRNGQCHQPVEAGLTKRFEVVFPDHQRGQRCAAYVARQAEPLPTTDYSRRGELDDRQIGRLEFRTELFQRHGWPLERAEAWADRLVERDTERDDRRLCVECRNLLHDWRCAQGGTVVAEQLQRCDQFQWEKPKS